MCRYARALDKAGVISAEDSSDIQRGLEEVRSEWASGAFETREGDEDIHTANERRLSELVGDAGARLHTGRSRNDQVATDLRMWLREEAGGLARDLGALIEVAAARAESEVDLLMPGCADRAPRLARARARASAH